MTLPATGLISLNQVNVELGKAGTNSVNLNRAAVRSLASVPSGMISMSNLRGKSAVVSYNITLTTGAGTDNGAAALGYSLGPTPLGISNFGSVSTNSWKGKTLYSLYHVASRSKLYLLGPAMASATGWFANLIIGGNSFAATAATFTADNYGYAVWSWTTATALFGASGSSRTCTLT